MKDLKEDLHCVLVKHHPMFLYEQYLKEAGVRININKIEEIQLPFEFDVVFSEIVDVVSVLFDDLNPAVMLESDENLRVFIIKI